MIIEEAKALGASILFFPEGKALQDASLCNSAAIPDVNDPGWVDFVRVEAWEANRKDVKYQPVKDSTTGKLVLADEVETDGYTEYKFTSNILLGLFVGLFFRSATPLTGNSLQFNPDQGISPRGWMIMANYDQGGTLILSANLWGRMKFDGPLKGGGGELVKPDLMFTQLKNSLNTMSLGS